MKKWILKFYENDVIRYIFWGGCTTLVNLLSFYIMRAMGIPLMSAVASIMQQDDEALPILDWVWFGVYRTEECAGIYTYGMRKFGKEEMEVYAANADLNDVRDFLLDIVTYVLDCDVTLNDGETIGFSEEQKLRITLSDAVALDGKSLKLEYPQ